MDDAGRLLLVRQADTMAWSTIGGAIEPDESPEHAAAREASEEAGIEVSLSGIRAVLGGPEFRVRYPNGDVTSYVTVVFDAVVVSGQPDPDDDETVATSWFSPAALPTADMTEFTKALLRGAACSLTDNETADTPIGHAEQPHVSSMLNPDRHIMARLLRGLSARCEMLKDVSSKFLDIGRGVVLVGRGLGACGWAGRRGRCAGGVTARGDEARLAG